MSRASAGRIVRNRVANEGYLLDTRSKLNELRDREVSRTQGRAALGALTQLDPINDPDYMNKVQGIIAQNPQATLDRTVSSFLGIQGDAFRLADQDRRRQEDDQRRRVLQEERDRRELELSDQRMRSSIDIRREAELEDEINSMPPSLLSQFNQYRESGLDPNRALAQVKEDAASAGALAELAELGIDLESPEIRGIPDPLKPGSFIREGVIGPNGRIDVGKVNSIKSRAIAEKAQAKEQDYLRKNARTDMIAVQRLMRDEEDEGTITPEKKQQYQAAIDEYARLAGLNVSLPSGGESGKVNGPTGATGTAPRPDTSAADKYIPR